MYIDAGRFDNMTGKDSGDVPTTSTMLFNRSCVRVKTILNVNDSYNYHHTKEYSSTQRVFYEMHDRLFL